MSVPDDLLPDYLHDGLTQLVRRAFSEARKVTVDGGGKVFSADHCLRLDLAVRACVENALLEERRGQNSERMRQLGLPNEIWLKVWEFLPMDSVLVVSHVCHLWRSLALGSPPLWTTLDFFSDEHAEDCGCSEHRALDRYDFSCRFCSRYVTIGQNNSELMRNLLPRSLHHGISLNLHIAGAPDPVTYLLADIIGPHAQRIVHWHFRGQGYFDPTPLLRSVDALPALRCLSLPVTGLQLSRNISLPNLEEAKVDYSIYSSDYDVATGLLSFPSVKTLHFRLGPTSIYSNALASTLSTMPNLQTLHLSNRPAVAPSLHELGDGRTLVSQIPQVRISDLGLANRSLIDIFYAPQHRSFIVEYESDYSAGFSAFAAHEEVHGFSIFADLGDHIELSITAHEVPLSRWDNESVELLKFAGSDSHGRHRCIQFPSQEPTPTLWIYIPLQSVTTLHVWAIFMMLFWPPELRLELPALHMLTISLPDGVTPDFALVAPPPRCPSLQTLRLVSDNDGRVKLPAEYLASFIGILHVAGGVLDELVLNRVIIDGDVSILAAVVRGGLP
ncbi:hypothetical protein EXIGLDRAFT_833416 [Exidia glandulosa HHB12029]|uniref:F-box domain-containing protein n=1 Tax=Exidia glandulosa HHB12029 TaxID=1314781 RepID=A0A165KQN3_EXIGL|nr:hypothetical protein EXIGLDRAFT_833416 [Exidia glandulosa HHB12029]